MYCVVLLFFLRVKHLWIQVYRRLSPGLVLVECGQRTNLIIEDDTRP